MKTHKWMKLILFNFLFSALINHLNAENPTFKSTIKTEIKTINIKTKKHKTKIQKKNYNDIQKEFEPKINLSLKKNIELFRNYDYYANPGYIEIISKAIGFEDFIFEYHQKVKSKKIRKHHKKDGKKGGLKKHSLIRYFNEEGDKIEKNRQEAYNSIKNFIEKNSLKLEQLKFSNILDKIIEPKKSFTIDPTKLCSKESLDKKFIEFEISPNALKLLKEEGIDSNIFEKLTCNEVQQLIANELINLLNQTADAYYILEIDETVTVISKIICYLTQLAQKESLEYNYEKSIDLCNLCQSLIEVIEQYTNLFIDSLKDFNWNSELFNYERLSLKIIENNPLFRKNTNISRSFIIFSNYINTCLNAAKSLTKVLETQTINKDIFQNVKQKNILIKNHEENIALSLDIILEVAKLLAPTDESFQDFIEEVTTQELVTSIFYSKNYIGLMYINSTISNIFLETAKLLEENTNADL